MEFSIWFVPRTIYPHVIIILDRELSLTNQSMQTENVPTVKWLKWAEKLPFTSSNPRSIPSPGCYASLPWLYTGLQHNQKPVFLSVCIHAIGRKAPQCNFNVVMLFRIRFIRSSGYTVHIGSLHFLPLVCIYQLQVLRSFLHSIHVWSDSILYGSSGFLRSSTFRQ